MMYFLRFVLVLIVGALLAGCAGQQSPVELTMAPAPAATEVVGYPVATTDALGGGYPAPTQAASAGYPVPTEETGLNIVPQLTVPAPASAQVGVVTGRILRRDIGAAETANEPFSADLYLGKVLSSTQGEAGLVQLDPTIAPRATIDTQGLFAFTDVPPGQYGLFLNTPQGAILLNMPTDGSAMVADVKGGDVIDLGELSYELAKF